jgi:hypothetical protein
MKWGASLGTARKGGLSRREKMGDKINILKTIIDFLRSTNFN